MNRPASIVARAICVSSLCAVALFGSASGAGAASVSLRNARVTASSSAPDFPSAGAIDGDRFSAEKSRAWQGAAGETNWWWQIHFDTPTEIGAILQITGDH